MRTRAWIEVVVAVLAAIAGLATAIYPRWFEALFEASPDDGSGALEWLIAVALLLAAVVLAVLARRDFRLPRTKIVEADG
jgi:protein-S-isoprenylcysteine O-methyltransferase Ste14